MRVDQMLDDNNQNDDALAVPEQPSRRSFLKLATGIVGGLALAPTILQASMRRERYLAFQNSNTGEQIRQVYWTPSDGYIRESLRTINWALRDHHNDQMRAFDVNVLDQLYALQLQIGSWSPIEIISAYRSPITNHAIAGQYRGVARNSYHLRAMALDVRLQGGRVADLYRAARALGAGGVGYYPRSNFVHIDSGPVRYWS